MAKKTTAKKPTSKKTTTKKPSGKKPAPKKASTDKARKAAIKEIDERLSGDKQDHEVPSAKEVTNNARLAAHAAKRAPKAATTRKNATDAARANVVRDKRPSGLDLAAQALAKSKEPLGAKDLAERAIKLGWQTKGKTPEATLYSAITREIKAKGDTSRFVKTGKGLFAAQAK